MDAIQKIREVTSEIDLLYQQAHEKKERLIEWCKENRDEIKKLYPQRYKIYKITDVREAFRCTGSSIDNLEDSAYYFKVFGTRYCPKEDLERYKQRYPTVTGTLLDCNLKQIDYYGFDRIEITYLEEIDPSNLPLKTNAPTQVYLMIDKSTGYYKIGRSINPRYRERTLQSEKPTVEILYTFDAIVSDEKQIHDMFAQKRLRGEWFDLSGSDIQSIHSYFNKSV